MFVNRPVVICHFKPRLEETTLVFTVMFLKWRYFLDTKTIGSISIGHRSDTKISNGSPIDVDQKVLLRWSSEWGQSDCLSKLCFVRGGDILEIQNLCVEIIIADVKSDRHNQLPKGCSRIWNNVTGWICVGGIGHILLTKISIAVVICLLMQSTSSIRGTKYQNVMFLISPCSYLCPIHWNLVFSREGRCSWNRRCPDYINNFIAYYGSFLY